MRAMPMPDDEAERLVALAETGLLDSEHEAVFDAIVALAASICGVPMAAITLIDRDRQWFKASIGIDDPETPREDAFCAHTILEPDALVVTDARVDDRFRDNPFVLGDAQVRFYAGLPLTTAGGHALGALCVIDRTPRRLDEAQRASLRHLATVVERLIDARTELLRQQRALRDAEARIREVAERDALTGLANRYRLYEEFERSAARARRHGHHRALLYLDVDRFKAINDRHGHAGGDAVLVEFAQRLKQAVRASDLVARLAGDEFVILLEDVHESSDAMRVAEAILAAVRPPVHHGDVDITIGTSIGIAFNTDPDEDADAWLHRADGALYAAKVAGRGDYRVAAA